MITDPPDDSPDQFVDVLQRVSGFARAVKLQSLAGRQQLNGQNLLHMSHNTEKTDIHHTVLIRCKVQCIHVHVQGRVYDSHTFAWDGKPAYVHEQSLV